MIKYILITYLKGDAPAIGKQSLDKIVVIGWNP